MTNPEFRLSDEDWQLLNKWAEDYTEVPTYRCIRELRDRVMSLENPHQRGIDLKDAVLAGSDGPWLAGGLVKDVMLSIQYSRNKNEQLMDTARAVVRAVADWADWNLDPTSLSSSYLLAQHLRREAEK